MLYYKNIKHNNFGRPIYSSYRLCGPIPKMYATQSSFTTPPISRNIMLSLYYNLLFNQYSHRYPSKETSPRTNRVNLVVLVLTVSNIQVDDPVHITPNLISTSLNQSLITHSLSLSNTRYLSLITISGFVFPFCYKVPRLSMEYCFNS